MSHAASDLQRRRQAWSAVGLARPRKAMLAAMIHAELLRGKHEGLNRGNGDPPIQV